MCIWIKFVTFISMAEERTIRNPQDFERFEFSLPFGATGVYSFGDDPGGAGPPCDLPHELGANRFYKSPGGSKFLLRTHGGKPPRKVCACRGLLAPTGKTPPCYTLNRSAGHFKNDWRNHPNPDAAAAAAFEYHTARQALLQTPTDAGLQARYVAALHALRAMGFPGTFETTPGPPQIPGLVEVVEGAGVQELLTRTPGPAPAVAGRKSAPPTFVQRMPTPAPSPYPRGIPFITARSDTYILQSSGGVVWSHPNDPKDIISSVLLRLLIIQKLADSDKIDLRSFNAKTPLLTAVWHALRRGGRPLDFYTILDEIVQYNGKLNQVQMELVNKRLETFLISGIVPRDVVREASRIAKESLVTGIEEFEGPEGQPVPSRILSSGPIFVRSSPKPIFVRSSPKMRLSPHTTGRPYYYTSPYRGDFMRRRCKRGWLRNPWTRGRTCIKRNGPTHRMLKVVGQMR